MIRVACLYASPTYSLVPTHCNGQCICDVHRITCITSVIRLSRFSFFCPVGKVIVSETLTFL